MYASRQVGNHLLSMALAQQPALDPRTLNVLAVIADGWHYALTDRRLILEDIVAGEQGPHFQDLITATRLAALDAGSGEWWPLTQPLPEPVRYLRSLNDNLQACSVLKATWRAYGHYSGDKLALSMMLPKTPWFNARVEQGLLDEATGIPLAQRATDADAILIDPKHYQFYYAARLLASTP